MNACWNRLSVLSLLLSVGALLPLQAQAPAAPAGGEIDELLALLNTPVTSASLISQKTIEAPSIIDVITRDQIQAYGWTHLNAILYRLPGFAPSMDFNHRTVSSRGLFESFPNNHLLHLVDGVPMNDPLYGTAWTWEMVPNLFMAKSVEILRGPGSALYGSNATSGVVHVKTLKARDLTQGGEAFLRLGEKGEMAMDFVTGHVGDAGSFVLGGSTLQTDGNPYLSYDGSLRKNPDGSLAKFMTWDKHPAQYLWFKAEDLGGLRGLVLQYHYNHFDWEFGQGNIMLWNDKKEEMTESRHLLSLSYQGQLTPSIQHSYLLRYQKRPYNWFTQEFPNGITVAGTTYENGLWENVDTEVQDWFGRTQWSFNLPASSNLIAGLEIDRFLYKGDRAHTSNVDLRPLVAAWPPEKFPNNEFRDVGPFMEWILDKPVTNVAFFAQFTSGKLLGDKLQATLGVRSDRTSFDYIDLEDPARTTGSKTYSQVSPRLALVFMATENFSIKAMIGKAFRAPAPIEFGVAHCYYTLSNIKQLEPEVINTAELAMDWFINKNLNLRVNYFDTKFDKMIGYDSLSVYRNLYSLDTRGLEAELLFGFGAFSGFLNYSYAKRYNEEIPDPGIALAKDTTWYPTHSANFGAIYKSRNWITSLSGRYQGRVERRESEVGWKNIPYFYEPADIINLDDYRPRTLDSWFVVDARAEYRVNAAFSVALVGTNLFDNEKNYLVKTFPFPFDFKSDPRRVSVQMKARF